MRNFFRVSELTELMNDLWIFKSIPNMRRIIWLWRSCSWRIPETFTSRLRIEHSYARKETLMQNIINLIISRRQFELMGLFLSVECKLKEV